MHKQTQISTMYLGGLLQYSSHVKGMRWTALGTSPYAQPGRADAVTAQAVLCSCFKSTLELEGWTQVTSLGLSTPVTHNCLWDSYQSNSSPTILQNCQLMSDNFSCYWPEDIWTKVQRQFFTLLSLLRFFASALWKGVAALKHRFWRHEPSIRAKGGFF